MPNWLRILLGILLVPFCIGAVSALVQVVRMTSSPPATAARSDDRPPAYMQAARATNNAPAQRPRTTGSAEDLWVVLLGGGGCWLSIYLLLPKPMRLYVLGHELTHVLWTWLFGGRVKKFKATARGGHVVITKTNFLIVLAPYFFPLYAVLVALFFVVGHLIWDWTPYLVWYHLLVGAAYAFHVTLTWNALQTHQTDISSQGYFFSAVVVFLGNIMVLLLGIPLVSHGQVSAFQSLGWWLRETWGVVSSIGRIFH